MSKPEIKVMVEGVKPLKGIDPGNPIPWNPAQAVTRF